MLERESRAEAKINELTRQLSAERQSLEQQLAETASLRSKLLGVETELSGNVQSDSHLCCVRRPIYLTHAWQGFEN
jgi:hypothetical protein